MSLVEWEKVIGKLDVYVQEYHVSGGEPTEHGQFFEILSILEKKGKFYHLFTNGLWKDADRILEGFTSCAHLNTINFSLHGPNYDVHNAFTQNLEPGKFETLLDNIRLAYSAGYSVNTNTVLHKENLEHIEEIAELATELGANHAIFSRYVGPQSDRLDISPDELAKAAAKIEELKSQGYNAILGNCIPFCHFKSPTAACFAGVTLASVDPCGSLKPCTFSGIRAGSLLKEEVTAVWRSKIMKKWRSRLPSQCKKCVKLSSCPGGCKAVSDFLELPHDPLVGETVKKTEQPQVLDVTLEEDLCPLARYIMRKEDFGWILIKGNQVIPVRQRAEKILMKLDGTVTLGEIQKEFGSGALSFIYSLYVRDFIEFRARTDDEEAKN
jgi:pyrroloquinoline quinone biosynthesis protein E